MTTSSLARPAFSQQEPAWPRLPAAPGQVTRSLCYRGLAALGAVELALILLSLVIAAASHSSVAQALVNLSPALVITGCVATGRAAGLLRAALAAGLTQRTALAAGLAVTASYALTQAPWAVLTTVLARAVPSEAEPGLLTPWAVPGWVLACLGGTTVCPHLRPAPGLRPARLVVLGADGPHRHRDRRVHPGWGRCRGRWPPRVGGGRDPRLPAQRRPGAHPLVRQPGQLGLAPLARPCAGSTDRAAVETARLAPISPRPGCARAHAPAQRSTRPRARPWAAGRCPRPRRRARPRRTGAGSRSPAGWQRPSAPATARPRG